MKSSDKRIARPISSWAIGFGLCAGILGTGNAQALDFSGAGLQTGTINGAYFQEIDTPTPAGTGVIDSFLRLQSQGNNTTEKGYNTDKRPLEFDENNSPQFTRSLLLNDVPIVNIGGVDYRQFILDINEPNADKKDPNLPLITLKALNIFLGNAGNLTGYPTFGGNATQIYNLTESLILRDSNSGSGRYDLLANIPNALFKGSNNYVYLYSEFTGAEGGFEEWAVRKPLSQPIPTPALLPGLIGMGLAALRKRKGETAEITSEQ